MRPSQGSGPTAGALGMAWIVWGGAGVCCCLYPPITFYSLTLYFYAAHFGRACCFGLGGSMLLKYLWYVLRHKWYVFIECCKLGIPFAGIVHDLSKFRADEFMPYARYFYGTYRTWDEVPAYERWNFPPRHTKESVARDFDLAWLRHQHRNPHHWQYWILQEDDGGYKKLPIPDRYRREMLADWRGAGLAIAGKDNTREWYVKNRDNMRLHPDARMWIEEQLGAIDAATVAAALHRQEC